MPIGRGTRGRRQGPGLGPQPARPAEQRHPPRRDRLPGEHRAAARVGLRARHHVHHAFAVRHVHRRHPALRHPARGHRRERARSWAARTTCAHEAWRSSTSTRTSASDLMAEFIAALPRDLERGHRRGVVPAGLAGVDPPDQARVRPTRRVIRRSMAHSSAGSPTRRVIRRSIARELLSHPPRA